MSTNSLIGKVKEDGSVEGIYCHWDGDPSYNGKILLESYKDEAKIDKLLELRSLSSLGKEIGDKVDFDDHEAGKGQCVSHYRDRDEKDINIIKSKSVEDFRVNSNYGGTEFVYTFKDGVWTCFDQAEDKSFELTEKSCSN